MLAGTNDSFSPSHICVHAGLGSSTGTISPWESKLAMFRKEGKKNLRAKTCKHASSEVQKQRNLKHTKQIEILILNPLK